MVCTATFLLPFSDLQQMPLATLLYFSSCALFDVTICGLTFYGAYMVSSDVQNGSRTMARLLNVLVRDGMSEELWMTWGKADFLH